MPNFDYSSEKIRQAREAFAGWLRERGAKDFEDLCTLHPDLRAELQAINSVFQLGQAAATSRTFHETLREQFGDATEVMLQLEEAGVVSPSGGTTREPAKARATSQS